MDPLKAAAATLFCLALFWLVLRLTQRLMEMAIAAGRAEEQRRADAEALAAQADQTAGVVP
ncbi:hypothetical protein [Methylobacterium persicinum]|uniref:Uncharacterized protein n=1 Tax=Methylobacterium persicinum TaxID=374426 RepID=A0ABU0HR45_9HYPH|nr:hypothetical protein [Methylobacterium persicinum]MDQ0444802.1 hypothetical protein [Methylobacterium persicinum]GJE38095.1 hypothetical protein KHHGKMAE_2161 [Methylobacterium persicinum]